VEALSQHPTDASIVTTTTEAAQLRAACLTAEKVLSNMCSPFTSAASEPRRLVCSEGALSSLLAASTERSPICIACLAKPVLNASGSCVECAACQLRYCLTPLSSAEFHAVEQRRDERDETVASTWPSWEMSQLSTGGSGRRSPCRRDEAAVVVAEHVGQRTGLRRPPQRGLGRLGRLTAAFNAPLR
jgi:hypothetical protein